MASDAPRDDGHEAGKFRLAPATKILPGVPHVIGLTHESNAELSLLWLQTRTLLEGATRQLDAERSAHAVTRASRDHLAKEASDAAVETGEKIGKYKPDSAAVYEAGRLAAPELATSSISAIQQAATARYLKDRWEMRRGIRSIPSFRDIPIPVRGSNLVLGYDSENRPMASFPLLSRDSGAEQTRFAVSLKCGAEFRPHRRLFDRIVAGELTAGEAKVQPLRGGGCMLRIVLNAPRTERRERSAVVTVKTRPDALLDLRIEGCDAELWVLNQDDLVRLAMRHAKHLDSMYRMSQDLKFERRAGEPDDLAAAREVKIRKDANRTKTAIDTIARIVANRCTRAGAKEVKLDFTDKSFLKQFEYHRLMTAIADRLAVEKIGVTKMDAA